MGTPIHCGEVHVDNLLASAAVGLLDGLLNILLSVFIGNHIGDLEEGRLQHGIDPAAQADLPGDFHSINVVEAQLLLCNGPLQRGGQPGLHLFYTPRRVEQEDSALLDACQKVIPADIGRIMTGDEVCLVN